MVLNALNDAANHADHEGEVRNSDFDLPLHYDFDETVTATLLWHNNRICLKLSRPCRWKGFSAETHQHSRCHHCSELV